MEIEPIAMESSPRPLVSVISLTYNRKERIASLLRALQQQDYVPFEVIVVDNASTDGTAEMIRGQFPDVQVIESPQNMANYSYTLGAEAARGDYWLMIDDDGLPGQNNWITEVVKRFEADPQLGAVACTVRMQDTGRIAKDSPQFIPEGDGSRGYPCAAYNGTGVGLRAAAVRPLLPMYPRYFFRSYIELHLCTRLIDSGWKVQCFPEIEVWHCRPSGTSSPPLAHYGLRNYYLYIWNLYPRPYNLTETLHELGSRLKMTVQGKIPVGRMLKAWGAAVASAKDAFRSRQPVSQATVEHLRKIRRHGNWHGLAPEFRQFDQD